MKILAFFFLFLYSELCVAQSILAGKVVRVSDGDTITILTEDNNQVKIRLAGIDCPEAHQDFGRKAKHFTSDFCFSKTVRVEVSAKDKYGRYLGIVTLQNGKNLNHELLKAGLAWHYKYFDQSKQLADLELVARTSKIGLWSLPNPIAPWDFRRYTRN